MYKHEIVFEIFAALLTVKWLNVSISLKEFQKKRIIYPLMKHKWVQQILIYKDVHQNGYTKKKCTKCVYQKSAPKCVYQKKCTKCAPNIISVSVMGRRRSLPRRSITAIPPHKSVLAAAIPKHRPYIILFPHLPLCNTFPAFLFLACNTSFWHVAIVVFIEIPLS